MADLEQKPRKRRLNLDQKRALKTATVATFIRQYTRKAAQNVDPNDRQYDRDIEQKIRRMRPEELDRLIREDEEDGT